MTSLTKPSDSYGLVSVDDLACIAERLDAFIQLADELVGCGMKGNRDIHHVHALLHGASTQVSEIKNLIDESMQTEVAA